MTSDTPVKQMLVEELRESLAAYIEAEDDLALGQVEVESAVETLLTKIRQSLGRAGVFVNRIELDQSQMQSWRRNRFARKNRRKGATT